MNRENAVDPVSEMLERVNFILKRKELSLILIVGAIGCIGTMSIFNKSFSKKASEAQNLSTIKIVEQAALVTPILQNIDPFLRIEGSSRMLEKMAFSIANFNPRATYEINFGDGTSAKGRSDFFEHTYHSEGSYEVELFIFYKEKTRSIFKTKLNISSSQHTFLSSL